MLTITFKCIFRFYTMRIRKKALYIFSIFFKKNIDVIQVVTLYILETGLVLIGDDSSYHPDVQAYSHKTHVRKGQYIIDNICPRQ